MVDYVFPLSTKLFNDPPGNNTNRRNMGNNSTKAGLCHCFKVVRTSPGVIVSPRMLVLYESISHVLESLSSVSSGGD